MYYWGTIMCSQTLGTALGQTGPTRQASANGGGIFVFAACCAVHCRHIYYFTKISHTLLFWPAFILTAIRWCGSLATFWTSQDEGGFATGAAIPLRRLWWADVILFVAFPPNRRSGKCLNRL